MMNLRPSDSDCEEESTAFGLLHAGVQRWLWKEKWTELHAIQERSIRPILEGSCDVLLSAPTAGGKTEAAFLPIISRLAQSETATTGCICISPLKALINDQYARLKELADCAEVRVTRWHGDVRASHKKEFIRNPSGILLITPESLEAHFVRRGTGLSSLYGELHYIVVDEIHAFVGTERGKQLQSLMHRLGYVTGRRIPRIGLSATLGDMQLAGKFMRPSGVEDTVYIKDEGEGREIKIALRGYRKAPPLHVAKETERADDTRESDESSLRNLSDVAAHMYSTLRGSNNLIFANSRTQVESLTDMLRRRCEDDRVPQEFFAHHGSLAKDIREHAENRLKDDSRPGNVVATTTLEMGIDIGNVRSIAQLGNPPSVASMRQRLGRSGRRGSDAAIMRIYVSEQDQPKAGSLQDALRAQIVQAFTMVELLIEGWTEAPDDRQLHMSTLVQQLLSIIAQHGGVRANDAWRVLCKEGAFKLLGKAKFGAFLREMGRRDLITQLGDGLLILGAFGEKLVDNYQFFAAFWTNPEYRIVHDGSELGSLPISSPMAAGSFLVFGGRRWEVIAVEPGPKVITVRRARGGRPPLFDGGPLPIGDFVRKRMFDLYCDSRLPAYLDQVAQELVSEGRRYFHSAGLMNRHIVSTGETTYIYPWRGDRIVNTIVTLFSRANLGASNEGVAIRVSAPPALVGERIRQILGHPPASAASLAMRVDNLVEEKYDEFLPIELLREDYATRHFDIPGALEVLTSINNDAGEVLLTR